MNPKFSEKREQDIQFGTPLFMVTSSSVSYSFLSVLFKAPELFLGLEADEKCDVYRYFPHAPY